MRVQLGGGGAAVVLTHDGRTIQIAVVDGGFLARRSGLGSGCSGLHGVVDDLDRLLDLRAQTGRDHGDVQLVAHVRIDDGTDLDGGVFGRELLDDVTDVGVLAQREVGTGYFDAVAMTVSQGISATTAMAESTETAQFH